MTTVQMVIIILMFLTACLGAYNLGKQAGKRELAMMIAEILKSGYEEIKGIIERYNNDGEE